MKKFTENIYIIEKLGQGGMGEVFKAKIIKPEQGFEKVVALKVLPEYTAQAEKKKEALLKEARIIAGLNHPNINQVYDVGETEGTPYVIMDLIEGHDLREIIKTAKDKGIHLATSSAIEIALNLLDALEYAHNLPSPIIHRDISPHNVMVTNQGVVKLLDFGLSKIQENTDQSKTEGYVGKYSYLPLEVIEGKTYKAEHDIYAVGLILYELLTLEKAYGGNLELEIIQRIKEGHIEPALTLNSKVPKELNELLKDWINPKESKRIKDTTEIKERLLSIKKNLISTSSLKEEIASLFSSKASLKGTLVEKRATAKSRKITFFKLPLIFILSSFVLVAGFILFYKGKQEREKPFIEVIIEDKSYDISPKIKEYTEYTQLSNGESYSGPFCAYYCSLNLVTASVFLDPQGTEPLERLSQQQKKPPADYYKDFVKLLINNSVSERILQGCSHIPYCKNTRRILNLFTVHQINTTGKESFKEIAVQNTKFLKESSLHDLWLETNRERIITFSAYEAISTILKKSNYYNISPVIGYDFIKMPNEHFPTDSHACQTWGTLLAHHFNKLNFNNFKFLLLPEKSVHQILGKKGENKLTLGFPDGGHKNDSIFSKGFCYIEFNDSNLSYSRFWIPDYPCQRLEREIDMVKTQGKNYA